VQVLRAGHPAPSLHAKLLIRAPSVLCERPYRRGNPPWPSSAHHYIVLPAEKRPTSDRAHMCPSIAPPSTQIRATKRMKKNNCDAQKVVGENIYLQCASDIQCPGMCSAAVPENHATAAVPVCAARVPGRSISTPQWRPLESVGQCRKQRHHSKITARSSACGSQSAVLT
jgi:hypothetical protein